MQSSPPLRQTHRSMHRQLPVDQIRTAALAQAATLLREWFPNGKVRGREFKIGSLAGEPGESLSINLDTGLWGEFNGGPTGRDLIALRAALKHGGNYLAAARELGDILGIGLLANRAPKPNGKQQLDEPEDWHPIVPPPEGAPPPPSSALRSFDVVYDYRDANDRLLHYIGRIEARGSRKKIFTPIVFGVLNEKRGWYNKGPASPKPLYGLNRLATMPDATVIVCEGEKSADAAQTLFPKYACVSWQGGTGSVEHADIEPLRGRRLIFWPDNDEGGRSAMKTLHAKLPHAQILRVDDLDKGQDAADLHVDDPEEWLRHHLPAPTRGGTEPWPAAMNKAAYHGLSGRVVEAIAPHTEADPVALLMQFLLFFGNAIGRGPYYQVESDKHRTNLFQASVGRTAKARKGTSAGRIRWVFEIADWGWTSSRVHSGMSSGEGLIWAVRDPITTREREGKGSKARYVERETDAGVTDKRLMVMESEFAGALRVMERHGNTLSRVLRDAWDGAKLSALTKNSPAHATGAHVSIGGHITADELRRSLNQVEIANGFANRFLFACVRRGNILPHGGNLSEATVAELGEATASALEHARKLGRIEMTPNARADWARVYPTLSEERPGLLGAVVARAEAQVVRLALLYALLDQKRVIDREHLRAALAVWQYCEDSARLIFGDRLGYPLADEILRAVKEKGKEGITRTEIRDLFNRNRHSGEIDEALAYLEQQKRARVISKSTGGRPAELWVATSGDSLPDQGLGPYLELLDASRAGQDHGSGRYDKNDKNDKNGQRPTIPGNGPG